MDNNKFYKNILKEIDLSSIEPSPESSPEVTDANALEANPETDSETAPEIVAETAPEIVAETTSEVASEHAPKTAPKTVREPVSKATKKISKDVAQEIVEQIRIPYPTENSQSSSSFIQKLGTTLLEGHVFGGIMIYLLYIANLIGTTIFARKASLGVTQSILYKFHIDSISFVEYTFLEVNILISYIFAFICGGFLIFAFLKVGSLIAKTAGLLYSHRVTRLLLVGFMALYLIISLSFIIAGNSFLSVPVYNWAMPFLAFAGGFCMYCVSLRNVNIY